MGQFPVPPHGTPAANADLLGDEASFDGRLAQPGAEAGGPELPGGSATGPATQPGGAAETAPDQAGLRSEGRGQPESGAAPAGQDINQAGFVKDPDGGRR